MNKVHITYATSEGSGEPAHPRSIAKAFAVRTHAVLNQTKGSIKIRHLAPLDGCACLSEELGYGGRKVS